MKHTVHFSEEYTQRKQKISYIAAKKIPVLDYYIDRYDWTLWNLLKNLRKLSLIAAEKKFQYVPIQAEGQTDVVSSIFAIKIG